MKRRLFSSGFSYRRQRRTATRSQELRSTIRLILARNSALNENCQMVTHFYTSGTPTVILEGFKHYSIQTDATTNLPTVETTKVATALSATTEETPVSMETTTTSLASTTTESEISGSTIESATVPEPATTEATSLAAATTTMETVTKTTDTITLPPTSTIPDSATTDATTPPIATTTPDTTTETTTIPTTTTTETTTIPTTTTTETTTIPTTTTTETTTIPTTTTTETTTIPTTTTTTLPPTTTTTTLPPTTTVTTTTTPDPISASDMGKSNCNDNNLVAVLHYCGDYSSLSGQACPSGKTRIYIFFGNKQIRLYDSPNDLGSVQWRCLDLTKLFPNFPGNNPDGAFQLDSDILLFSGQNAYRYQTLGTTYSSSGNGKDYIPCTQTPNPQYLWGLLLPQSEKVLFTANNKVCSTTGASAQTPYYDPNFDWKNNLQVCIGSKKDAKEVQGCPYDFAYDGTGKVNKIIIFTTAAKFAVCHLDGSSTFVVDVALTDL
ncbi:unnamed protein product [Darwinula stevensoni]|uniref:Uncharacterized protein n=1 Tax=Darwinula stevensoni TaxID=69355 RepID=A0A7R8X9M4_9CRUS|nr:unnamed protein product [Darwinula stevensoni]CAG0889797.1 unnamed protein product [Darwinula stevensoni]